MNREKAINLLQDYAKVVRDLREDYIFPSEELDVSTVLDYGADRSAANYYLLALSSLEQASLYFKLSANALSDKK